MWQPGIKLDEIERSVILKALSFFQGNRTATAKSLGIALRTLTSKLDQYKKSGFEVTPAQNPPGIRSPKQDS